MRTEKYRLPLRACRWRGSSRPCSTTICAIPLPDIRLQSEPHRWVLYRSSDLAIHQPARAIGLQRCRFTHIQIGIAQGAAILSGQYVDLNQRFFRSAMVDFNLAESTGDRKGTRASWKQSKPILLLWGPAALACAPLSPWRKPTPLSHSL